MQWGKKGSGIVPLFHVGVNPILRDLTLNLTAVRSPCTRERHANEGEEMRWMHES
jgi:hypothetical protein